MPSPMSVCLKSISWMVEMSDSAVYGSSNLNNVLRPNIEKELGFKIAIKEKEIFRSLGSSAASRIEWLEKIGQTVRDAAERLNLIQLSTEFYPSIRDHDLATTHGVKFDSQKDDGWSSWFREITLNKTLLPDTNILLKRILSAVIFPAFTTRKHTLSLPFQITIPRFSLLELENLANTGEDTNRVKVSKGECFMAFNEIRNLKTNGATLTAPLSPDELSLFHSAAGRKLMDVLIRGEIRRFADLGETSSMGRRSIFVTRDMVSALAANCEELSAIYIAPKHPEQTFLENIALDELRELIIEVATTCGKVELEWDNGEKLQIEGTWSGKNWYDYYRRRVRVNNPK